MFNFSNLLEKGTLLRDYKIPIEPLYTRILREYELYASVKKYK